MKPMVTICEGGPYRVESGGNGLFVKIVHFPTRREVFLQGDDAAKFLDDMQAADPNLAYEKLLPLICDAYF